MTVTSKPAPVPKAAAASLPHLIQTLFLYFKALGFAMTALSDQPLCFLENKKGWSLCEL